MGTSLLNTAKRQEQPLNIASLPLAMYRCTANEKWTMQYLSEGFNRIFGHPCDDIINDKKRPFSELIHPDDLESTYKILPRLSEKQSFSLQYRLQRADGRFVRVEDRGTLIKQKGARSQVEGVLIPLDNGGRPFHQEQKKTARIDYSKLFDITPNFVCVIDRHGNFEAVNHTFLNRFQFSEDEFYSRPVLSFVHESDREVTRHQMQTARAGGTISNFRTRIYTCNGELITILWAARREERSRRIYAIGQDITEIVRKKQELKESNERFYQAAAAGNEMIWEWEPEENRVKRYGNYDQLLGEEAKKRLLLDPNRWFERIHREDIAAFKQSLDEALKNPQQKRWEHEYRILNKDNEYAYILDRGMISRARDGSPRRMVGAALDVTRSRKMMDQIASQNARLRKIAWTQSHKLRAPLARAMGLMNMITEEDHEDIDQKELLGYLNDSLHELDGIIAKVVSTVYE
ncbi:MAG: PAS domain-containing protein [Cyclonatronaceae bacterium]